MTPPNRKLKLVPKAELEERFDEALGKELKGMMPRVQSPIHSPESLGFPLGSKTFPVYFTDDKNEIDLATAYRHLSPDNKELGGRKYHPTGLRSGDEWLYALPI